jgi:hypothetical protein
VRSLVSITDHEKTDPINSAASTSCPGSVDCWKANTKPPSPEARKRGEKSVAAMGCKFVIADYLYV